MTPVIRIDDEVMNELKKRAVGLGLVFEPPNVTLRRVLGLDSEILPKQSPQSKQVTENEIELKLNASSRKYVYIPLPKDKRLFFPGYKVDFELKTDVETVKAHVTSEPNGASVDVGDPHAGTHIRGGFGPWFAKHQELRAGDKLRIQALVPGKLYELSTVDKVIDTGTNKAMPDANQQAIVDDIVKKAIEKYNRGIIEKR